jgi:2-methylcitrate dehydratase PrpD
MRRNVGTMTKAMHAGNAARAGVIAATLARSGFTANDSILNGGFGFCDVFTARAGTKLGDLSADLGRTWNIVQIGLGFKPYPCCRATHAGIDCVLHLRNTLGIDSSEIDEIVCRTAPALPQLLPYHNPKTPYEAKFSMEYCLATALLRGKVTLDDFTHNGLEDPRIQALGSLLVLEHPDDWGAGAVDLTTEVTITLRQGESLSHRVSIPRGEPGNPMQEQELMTKFRSCSNQTFGPDRTESLLNLLDHVEDLEDVSQLTELL